MSYSFDGKISNQCPILLNYSSAKTMCSKCSRIIEAPSVSIVEFNKKNYIVRDYLKNSHFIYETKSGISVVYCSQYCRNKHNHRFIK